MRVAILVCALLAILSAQPVFALTPNDPDFGEQWYLTQVDAPGAWDMTEGSDDVVVAVLDSGVDLDHPDLAPNLWTNPGEIAGDGVDNDQNGFIDDVHGWDFVEGDATPTPTPDEPFDESAVAHGTALAGVIGAVGNNGAGVAGIDWHVRIMPVRILDNFGSGSSRDAASAVDYAVANGADVINLSFTGTEVDTVFQQAVENAWKANVVVVAAVGNADDGGINLNDTPIYPACFMGAGEDWVIGVAATTEEDTKADFSNYGSTCTDIAAPGQDMFSTMYENQSWDDFTEAYLGGWAGTSIASPVVAGAAALLRGAYPSLTASDILTVLQLSVDPVVQQGVAWDGQLGAGRINIARALEIAPTFVSTSLEPPTDEEAGVVRDADGHRAAPSSGILANSPASGHPEEVSKVYAGWYIRSPSFNTIYFVDAQMLRHPLWDAQTYFTWNDSWDDTVWVTDATLSTLSLGTPVVPKPGVVLVKIQSDPNVYAVETGELPVLRKIASESLAVAMFGAAWADYVVDIEPTLFTKYARGADITQSEPVDLSIMKTRAEIASQIASP